LFLPFVVVFFLPSLDDTLDLNSYEMETTSGTKQETNKEKGKTMLEISNVITANVTTINYN